MGAQPGASYVEYGSTYEQRPLHAIVFTHPDNLDRLEDIRLQHLDRVNGGTGDAAFDELAVVWMSYNVHGNEAVCTEAALEVMHALAEKCAAENAMMKRLVVLVILASTRMATTGTLFGSTNMPASLNADPNGMEHDEPWPGGRPNHYLFDLNRDWAWQSSRDANTIGPVPRVDAAAALRLPRDGLQLAVLLRTGSRALPRGHHRLAT